MMSARRTNGGGEGDLKIALLFWAARLQGAAAPWPARDIVSRGP
jgi:hypothetical protein